MIQGDKYNYVPIKIISIIEKFEDFKKLFAITVLFASNVLTLVFYVP